MSSERIVQEYLGLESKSIESIETLAKKYDLTTRGLISFLKQYNIKTPKLFSRMEAMTWNESKDNTENISNEIKLDNDISVAVSIERYFHDLGFDKKKGSEKTKAMCYFLETRHGIEPFSLFTVILESLIKDKGVFRLEKVLEAIKNRDLNTSETTMDNKRDSIMNQIHNKMLNMTKDIILAEENERKEKIREGFRIMNNAFKNEHRRKVREGRKIINSVLEKPKPKVRVLERPEVVRKPRPKPRKKREFTGEQVIKLLESA